MKKFTKIAAFILSALMVLGMAACGSNTTPSGNKKGLDVDPASLQFPLAEKAEISGLTSFPVGTYLTPTTAPSSSALKRRPTSTSTGRPSRATSGVTRSPWKWQT